MAMTERLNVMVDPKTKGQLEDVAKWRGISLSEYIRRATLTQLANDQDERRHEKTELRIADSPAAVSA